MYKFLNRNPLNKKLPDCVCRAISLALRIPYGEVMEMLYDNGDCYNCDELTVNCYSKMLTDMGLKSVDAGDRTVAELCSDYPDNIILARLEGHLTCCVNGDCYDIWDCTGEKADKFWIVG